MKKASDMARELGTLIERHGDIPVDVGLKIGSSFQISSGRVDVFYEDFGGHTGASILILGVRSGKRGEF